jgi:hypothetical protein
MRQADWKRLELDLLKPQTGRHVDRQLESLIRADLRNSSYDEVGRVKCTLNERVLTLTGRVSSYYLKQIAQRIALARLEGTVTLVDELQVEP